MTQFVIANNVNTQLAAAASSGATTLTLASSANLPTLSAGQVMPLTLNDAATGQNYEIVYVTAISGVTLTVTRAREGTGALNWSIGDYAYCAPTAATVATSAGSPTNTFQVAAATALTHAPEAGQVQQAAFNYAGLAGGTANALTATLSVAPGSYSDWLVTTARVASNNTGGTSLNVNGLGVVPVIGGAHQPLQGGELVAGGFATFAYSTNYSEAILLESTGGAMQVGAATQSQHAAQFGQVSGVVGSVRNLLMSVGTASASATLTADEIIAETALGGLRYCVAGFSQAINLGTTGANGMDTGSAPTSGFVAIYSIYNPTLNTWALLATNATAVKQPNVYGGAHMPSGYTASALVSVWPTNSSGQFAVGHQIDRYVYVPQANLLATSAINASWTSFNSSAIPLNARIVSGTLFMNNTLNSSSALSVATDANGIGLQSISGLITSGDGMIDNFSAPIKTSQTLYYQSAQTAGSSTFVVALTGYTF